MRGDYYGIQITSTPVSDRWRWKVRLPLGTTITSNCAYDTAEEALRQAKAWVTVETAFNSLNQFLAELCSNRVIQQQEYCNLMHSFIDITRLG